jgi:hypothetical protein
MVGKTSLGISNVGHTLAAAGYTEFTRNGGGALNVGRNGNNGALAQLFYDGSVFGKIGVNGDDNLNIYSTAADHAGLEFGTHIVAPLEAGSSADGTINLGASTVRFNDGFFSGTVSAATFTATTEIQTDRIEGYSSSADSITFGSTSINFNPNGNTRMSLTDGGALQLGNQVGGTAAILNIDRNDGNGQRYINFTENGSGNFRGAIGEFSNDLWIASTYSGFRFDWSNTHIVAASTSGAGVDNADSLGNGSIRWKNIYATNGTIQTSDEREKQQIASLTNAEITAATAISKLFKTYKWNSTVANEGENARIHSGVVSQQVAAAMEDVGLDASRYAFWCEDISWHVVNEDGTVDEEYETEEEAPEGAVKNERMGIRYPELLAFIGAATEQRLSNIETRLTALEG